MYIKKYYPDGRSSYFYPAEIIEHTDEVVACFSLFASEDRDLGYTTFARGDRFTEYFYFNHHFNVLRVESHATQTLRGWYCNISLPPVLEGSDLTFVDLYLDVWVDAAGNVLILDEDEFASAEDLTDTLRELACEGLSTVLQWVEQRTGPFAELDAQK